MPGMPGTACFPAVRHVLEHSVETTYCRLVSYGGEERGKSISGNEAEVHQGGSDLIDVIYHSMVPKQTVHRSYLLVKCDLLTFRSNHQRGMDKGWDPCGLPPDRRTFLHPSE